MIAEKDQTEKDQDVISAALGMMTEGPKNLGRCLKGAQVGLDEDGRAVTVGMVLTRCKNEGDSVRQALRKKLIQWDATTVDAWTMETAHSSLERREIIYGLLGLGDSEKLALRNALPPYIPTTTVIDGTRPEWTDWFNPTAIEEHGLYWRRYKDFLENRKGFSERNLLLLDTHSTEIVRRLANPSGETALGTRGLVVGYVQSGKTANLTAVIAKAIDAGYRYIIVLAGRTDILRNQTQRRLDLELVGRQNLCQPDSSPLLPIEEYAGDPAWSGGGFLDLGGDPEALDSVGVTRLTSKTSDFKPNVDLRFELAFSNKAVFEKDNLDRMQVRLAVVKKVPAPLKNLNKQFKLLSDAQRSQLPVLIIDDESDEASPNTVDPKRVNKKSDSEDKPDKSRTAINQAIGDLLKQLPRAQYIGYTATPFANVFVNPDDYVTDIFPRDFIICLGEPDDYMGAKSFCDLDEEFDAVDYLPDDLPSDQISAGNEKVYRPAPPRDIALRSLRKSNRMARVRGIIHSDDERTPRLQEALDAYVLSGAIKLWRQSRKLPVSIRHHTMLVHESVKQSDAHRLMETVEDLWNRSDYHSPSGLRRLKELFVDDYLPVSLALKSKKFLPNDFAALKPHVSDCIQRVGTSPVLVVNSSKVGEVPDFDTTDIWKILVGGQKLSRGYTVEGLTVSYFRRRPGASDTLMQTGRWFGYRNGYEDLVRLYLGRREPFKKGKSGQANRHVDLYEWFRMASRDEEIFRRQLTIYMGQKGITPYAIPPIVTASNGDILVTARNKQYNAKVQFRNFGETWIMKTLFSREQRDLVDNTALMSSLLEGSKRIDRNGDGSAWKLEATKGSTTATFEGFVFQATHAAVLSALENFKWSQKKHQGVDDFNPMDLELRFLSGEMSIEDGVKLDPQIDDWLIILPQIKKSSFNDRHQIGGVHSAVVDRATIGDGDESRFKVIGEPRHRPVAEVIAGWQASYEKALSTKDPYVKRLCSSRRGVMLLFAVGDRNSGDDQATSIGFELVLPRNTEKRVIGIGVDVTA